MARSKQQKTSMTSTVPAAKNEIRFFYEDVVCQVVRGELQFGMVVANSEYFSSDDDDDDEDEDGEDDDDDDNDSTRTKPGFVRVHWHPRGRETNIAENKVGLVDRSLLPGDVVRRESAGCQSQRGYCRQVSVSAAVQVVGTDWVICSVDSKELKPTCELSEDVVVCLDAWLGMPRNIKIKLRVGFADGSVCEMDDQLAGKMMIQMPKASDYYASYESRSYSRYYPSQILSGPLHLFQKADFLNCTNELRNRLNSGKNQKVVTVTVIETIIEQVEVEWRCRTHCPHQATNYEQPKTFITGDEIKRLRNLNVFQPSTFLLGEKCIYVVKESDLIVTRDQWKRLEKQAMLAAAPEVAKPNPPCSSSTTTTTRSKSLRPSVKCHKNGSSPESAVSGGAKKKSAVKISHSPTLSGPVPTVTAVARGLSRKKASQRHLSKAASKCSTAPPSTFKFLPGDEVIVEAVCTHSKVTVMWQDGTMEHDVPSYQLYPVHDIDDHEFFPGDFVVHSADKVAAGSSFDRLLYGVVQRVDHAGRMCQIQWFRSTMALNDNTPEKVELTEEPVYDLIDHPDYNYRAGQIVMFVGNSNVKDQTGQPSSSCCYGGQVLDISTHGLVTVWWADDKTTHCLPQDLYKFGDYDSDDLWEEDDDDGDDQLDSQSAGSWETESSHTVNLDEENECSALEEEEATATQLPSDWKWDAVLGMEKDLQMLIGSAKALLNQPSCDQPLAACLTKAYTTWEQALSHMKNLPRDGQPTALISESAASASQDGPECETDQTNAASASHPERSTMNKEEAAGCESAKYKVLLELCSKVMMCRLTLQQLLVHADEPSPSAYQLLQHLLSDMSELTKDLSQVNPAKPVVCGEPDSLGASAATVNEPDAPQDVTQVAEAEEAVAMAAAPCQSGMFSLVECAPPEHMFYSKKFEASKSFSQRVAQEMAMLKSSLPPGIQVLAFEDRLDLYSVMITGPDNTPYQDGLFFFDIQLSDLHPSCPPSVHYFSFCTDRLNPNLYESGKVCISLLGTWRGKGTEKWHSKSSLLQVLISIQGLILVQEPYYNEAGYERMKGTRQGSENSRLYNEMVLLKLLQSMTALLQRPPVSFTSQVEQHFLAHGDRLIERLQSWIKWSCDSVCGTAEADGEGGQVQEEARSTLLLPGFPLIPVSRGFCTSLSKALSQFQSALSQLHSRH